MIKDKYENEVRLLLAEIPEAFNGYERSGDPDLIKEAYTKSKNLMKYLGTELAAANIQSGRRQKKEYKGLNNEPS